MQWIHDRDRNTRTYHLVIIIRRSWNKILKLKKEVGEWLDSLTMIKDHTLKAFDKRFLTSKDKFIFDNSKPGFWKKMIKIYLLGFLMKMKFSKL